MLRTMFTVLFAALLTGCSYIEGISPTVSNINGFTREAIICNSEWQVDALVTIRRFKFIQYQSALRSIIQSGNCLSGVYTFPANIDLVDALNIKLWTKGIPSRYENYNLGIFSVDVDAMPDIPINWKRGYILFVNPMFKNSVTI